jgi:hypothetical protein
MKAWRAMSKLNNKAWTTYKLENNENMKQIETLKQ